MSHQASSLIPSLDGMATLHGDTVAPGEATDWGVPSSR